VPVAAPVPTPAPATARPGGADPVALELALWDSVKAASTAGELQTYLNRYPGGIFSDVARARIAALNSIARDKAASEKAANERASNERATAEAYLKAAAERAAAERVQAAQPASKTTDPLALEMAFWESVKTSQRSAELQAYLTQFPGGHFALLAKARLDEIKDARNAALSPVKASEEKPVQSMPLPEGVIGTLVLTDTLTGVKRKLDVKVEASDAEKTVYSSGDVIAKDGKVLQVRIGEAVMRSVSGALWTFPLKAGTSGEAEIERIDAGNQAKGKLNWKSVAAGEGKVKVEAEVMVRFGPGGSESGKWLATYSSERPLAESFSSVFRGRRNGGPEVNMVSAELKQR